LALEAMMMENNLAKETMTEAKEMIELKRIRLTAAQPKEILNNQSRKKTVVTMKVKLLSGQITEVQTECL
jgi:hypothetical protein